MKFLCRTVLILSVCLVGFALSLRSQALPDPMSPPRLVNDFAGLLNDEQRRSLEQKLTDFDRETSTQIAVVTVDDLNGYAPSEFAQRLHDKWGIGRKGKDNGILVLVKPRTDSPGEAYISVGYGLEGVVPDITAGRILDNEMIPSFQQGDLYAGIDKATTVLMQLTRGEFTADEYDRKHGSGAGGPMSLILLFLLFAFLLTLGRRGRGGGNGSHGGGSGRWIPPIILGGGGPRGSGGFGGFGGFGGGMSGGGGAGRSW